MIRQPRMPTMYDSRWDWIRAKGGRCAECGIDKMHLLQIDHIDPTQKDPVLKERRPFGSDIFKMPVGRRIRELGKCQVLCRACHRRKSGAEAKAKAIQSPWYFPKIVQMDLATTDSPTTDVRSTTQSQGLPDQDSNLD